MMRNGFFLGRVRLPRDFFALSAIKAVFNAALAVMACVAYPFDSPPPADGSWTQGGVAYVALCVALTSQALQFAFLLTFLNQNLFIDCVVSVWVGCCLDSQEQRARQKRLHDEAKARKRARAAVRADVRRKRKAARRGRVLAAANAGLPRQNAAGGSASTARQQQTSGGVSRSESGQRRLSGGGKKSAVGPGSVMPLPLPPGKGGADGSDALARDVTYWWQKNGGGNTGDMMHDPNDDAERGAGAGSADSMHVEEWQSPEKNKKHRHPQDRLPMPPPGPPSRAEAGTDAGRSNARRMSGLGIPTDRHGSSSARSSPAGSDVDSVSDSEMESDCDTSSVSESDSDEDDVYEPTLCDMLKANTTEISSILCGGVILLVLVLAL
jgi:hypothetical protein